MNTNDTAGIHIFWDPKSHKKICSWEIYGKISVLESWDFKLLIWAANQFSKFNTLSAMYTWQKKDSQQSQYKNMSLLLIKQVPHCSTIFHAKQQITEFIRYASIASLAEVKPQTQK